MSTNLIDTYVSEVGRRLPRKTRADIEAEIRSILQDMLEERSQKTGKPVDDEMTFEVLKAYGAPEKVAATYLGERYLIGPRLYPIFMTVVRIALMVTGILAAIGLGIVLYQAALTPWNLLEIIIKNIANFVSSAFTVLGNIVKEKEWDPHSLVNLSKPNQVKMGETIVEIVGCFVAIVIFNFYPQIIGVWFGSNGSWYVGVGSLTVTPLLSKTFFHFVPYLTLVWGFTIVLNIFLLRMGHWNAVTRISLIGLKIVNIVIAAAMLGVPSLLAITSVSLTTALGDAQAARTLMTLLSQIVRVALWLTIIGNSIEIIRAAYRLVTNERFPFTAPGKR